MAVIVFVYAHSHIDISIAFIQCTMQDGRTRATWDSQGSDATFYKLLVGQLCTALAFARLLQYQGVLCFHVFLSLSSKLSHESLYSCCGADGRSRKAAQGADLTAGVAGADTARSQGEAPLQTKARREVRVRHHCRLRHGEKSG